MKKVVLSALVENSSGVLSRVSSLFSRRGFNIESFTAGVTMDPNYTRMTIVTTCDSEEQLEQIQKQFAKLVDVIYVKVLPEATTVSRELLLVKVEADATQRPQVIAVADIFRAKIVDVAENSVMIELTGNENKLSAFLSLISDFKILELARTGITSMSRGIAD